MSERPILFSGPMVRAILAGTKTQTRRVVRERACDPSGVIADWSRLTEGAAVTWMPVQKDGQSIGPEHRCPYGVPGDRLWVRETWGYRGGCWSTNRPDVHERRIAYRADDARQTFVRPADDETGIPEQVCRCKPPGAHDREGPTDEHIEELERYWKSWRTSIHMPRWASRLTLEVTGIRVQRLQAMKHEDFKAEGMETATHGVHAVGRTEFSVLWDVINGKRAPWSSNPWVWAITFRRSA